MSDDAHLRLAGATCVHPPVERQAPVHALGPIDLTLRRIGVMSARPGVFIDLVETGWPSDRDSRIVSKPALGEVTARIWAALRDQSMKALAAAS